MYMQVLWNGWVVDVFLGGRITFDEEIHFEFYMRSDGLIREHQLDLLRDLFVEELRGWHPRVMAEWAMAHFWYLDPFSNLPAWAVQDPARMSEQFLATCAQPPVPELVVEALPSMPTRQVPV